MPNPILNDPLTLEALGEVRAESLLPAQQPTSRGTLVSNDTYQQRLLKYPERAVFHSYAELIYAILLESRKTVTSLVPHPYLIYIKNRQYIPDFFVIDNGERLVIELQSSTDTAASNLALIERYFFEEGIRFQVISNEEVLQQEAEARHWMRLIQVMVVATRYGIDTKRDEFDILEQCQQNQTCVADVVHPGCREQWQREVALYRLLHQHRLSTDLKNQYLDYDSELSYVVNVA